MSRNALYFIICLLIVAGGAMGYQLYAAREKTNHVQIDFGKNGFSIKKD